MGEVGVAKQAGALGAQPHHLGDDRLVVGLAAIVAARDEGAVHLFAQVAALREFQERLGARTRQRHDVTAKLAFLRLGFHRLAHEVGQAGKLGLFMQGQCEALLIGEHILDERRAKLRQPLDDLRQPLFRLAVERGPGAAKGCVIALEHALLLGGEVERLALPHQSVDAAEELCVGVELVPVARDLRRELALDLKQRVVAVGAGQKMEHLLDPPQRPPAQLERRDGIGEIRRLPAAGNGRDLRLVLGEGTRIGRREMLWPDLLKRGHLARGGPMREKGVFAVFLRVHAGFSPKEDAAYI